jgi:hypothetical protein
MAGGGRGISVGNVLPGRTGAQHPQNPVQHLARVPPWAAAAVGPGVGLRNQRFEDGPLRVLEFHGSLLGIVRDAVREQLNSSDYL